MMKMIRVTIDEALLAEVDQVARSLNTTRSAFVRDALHLALRRHTIAQMERRHAQGYAAHPVTPGEFDPREPELDWRQP
jgi:metal-responsive CopG/Arc/MetJ family transcriptional regulator